MAAKPEATTDVLTPAPETTGVEAKPEGGAIDTFDPNAAPDASGGGGADTGGYDAPTPDFDPSTMGDPTQMLAMMAPFMMGILIVGLLIAVFSIFCWWKIFSKAGHNGALSLVFIAGIIPFIGPLICLGLFIWFTFSDWPALKGQGAKT